MRAKQVLNCGKESKKMTYLNKHMKRKHGKRADFECDNCKKGFGKEE